MSKSPKDQKHQSYNGLRFGSLSGEQNEEMQKAMLNGLKAINGYFDSSSGTRKNLLVDMKMATTVVNAYAKLRQADSGFAIDSATANQDERKRGSSNVEVVCARTVV